MKPKTVALIVLFTSENITSFPEDIMDFLKSYFEKAADK